MIIFPSKNFKGFEKKIYEKLTKEKTSNMEQIIKKEKNDDKYRNVQRQANSS